MRPAPDRRRHVRQSGDDGLGQSCRSIRTSHRSPARGSGTPENWKGERSPSKASRSCSSNPRRPHDQRQIHPRPGRRYPGALEALEAAGHQPSEFLDRYARGDWGDLDGKDKAMNDSALIDVSHLLSADRTRQAERIWIITEARWMTAGGPRRAYSCPESIDRSSPEDGDFRFCSLDRRSKGRKALRVDDLADRSGASRGPAFQNEQPRYSSLITSNGSLPRPAHGGYHPAPRLSGGLDRRSVLQNHPLRIENPRPKTRVPVRPPRRGSPRHPGAPRTSAQAQRPSPIIETRRIW